MSGWRVAAALTALLSVTCYPNPDELRPDTGGGQCTNPEYPQYCPATATYESGCWESDTSCSTITTCEGVPKACSDPAKKVYCAGQKCCTPPAIGGACNLPDCGCAAGQVCYPSTPTAGMVCGVTSNLQAGAECNGGSACASGLGCFGGVCKKFCQVDTDCTLVDGVRDCLQTHWSSTGANISGVLICERVCDPVTPQSTTGLLLACPTGFGCSITDSVGITFCQRRTGTGTARAACTDSRDCAPGYFCDDANVCWKYCSANSDCGAVSASSTCAYFAAPGYYAGARQLGGCTQ